MKKIKLTQGRFAIVDDDTFDILNGYKWHARRGTSGFYAVRRVLKKKGEKSKTTHVKMHNYILKPFKGFVVDHINHDTLDNRKENLRLSTLSQNMFNKNKYKNNKSGYKGVFWNIQTKKWRSVIRANYKRIHLGYFLDKKEAACAYNKAAEKYHGKYALINNI